VATGHRIPAEFPTRTGPDGINLIEPLSMLYTGEDRGIPFGIDEEGKRFSLDIVGWQRADRIGSTVIQIYGEKGSGKTAAGMILAGRYHRLRAKDNYPFHRVVANDTRRNAGVAEYAGLAAFLSEVDRNEGISNRDIAEIDITAKQINPLDSRMNIPLLEQHYIADQLGTAAIERAFDEDEFLGLKAAVDLMNQRGPDITSLNYLDDMCERITNEEIRAHLDQSSQIAVKGLMDHVADEEERRKRQIEWRRALLNRDSNVATDDIRLGAGRVSKSLKRLLGGDGHIFSGEEDTLRELLTQPAVISDFTNVNHKTQPLLETLLWSWRSAAISNFDQDLMAHVELHDENWLDWESPIYARNMLAHIKRIRGAGTILVMMTHRPGDASSLPGEEQRSAYRTSQRAADVRLIGRSDPNDVKDIREYVPKLTDEQAAQIPNLRTGEFVVCIGQETPFVIRLTISDAERRFIETNQAARDQEVSWEKWEEEMDEEAKLVAANWGY